jgi:hypothetical protein
VLPAVRPAQGEMRGVIFGAVLLVASGEGRSAGLGRTHTRTHARPLHTEGRSLQSHTHMAARGWLRASEACLNAFEGPLRSKATGCATQIQELSLGDH